MIVLISYIYRLLAVKPIAVDQLYVRAKHHISACLWFQINLPIYTFKRFLNHKKKKAKENLISNCKGLFTLNANVLRDDAFESKQ